LHDIQEHRGVQVRRLLQIRTCCLCRYTPAAAANLPAAVAMQDPEDDQMGVDLEEFTCGAGLGPGCTKTYKTCPSFWVELGKKHQKAYVTPTSCRYCRKIKRENWANHRRPNMKVDSDGKTVEVVADLAMAALEPADEPFLSDLDADDDDAMAGYASSFFSDLMMTIGQEEVTSTTRTHIRTQNAADLFEAITASCTQFEQDYGEPVPAPPEQQPNIKMPEPEPAITPVAPPANISAGAAPAERECTQQAAAQNLKSSLEAGELTLETLRLELVPVIMERTALTTISLTVLHCPQLTVKERPWSN
jgi:hypothetical protein